MEARRTVGEMRGLPDTTKKARDDPQDEPRSRSFYTPSLARVALVGAVWWIIVHPPDVSSLLAMAVGAVLGVIYMWRGE